MLRPRVFTNENQDPQRQHVAQGDRKRVPLSNVSNIKRSQPPPAAVKPEVRKTTTQVTVSANTRAATKRSANNLSIPTHTKKARPLPEMMEVEIEPPMPKWRDIDVVWLLFA